MPSATVRRRNRVADLNARRNDLWGRLEGLCHLWQSDYTHQNQEAFGLVIQIVSIIDQLVATLTRLPTRSFRQRLLHVLNNNELYGIITYGYDKHRGRPSATYFMMGAYNWPNVGDIVRVPVYTSNGSFTLVDRTVSYIGVLTFTIDNETDLKICGISDMPS